MAITYSAQFQRASSEHAAIVAGSQTGTDFAGSFTVEMWLKSDTDLTANGSDVYTLADRDYPFLVRYVRNTTAGEATVQFYAKTGTNYILSSSTTYVPSTSGWNHIAFTANASTGDLLYYFNGVKRLENLGTGFSGAGASSDEIEIAARSSTNTWNGNICQVRLWDDVRTPTEIADYYDVNFAANPKDRHGNLVAEWKMDNDLLDATSNNNDLTASGTITFETDIPTLTDETVSTTYTWDLTTAGSFILTGNNINWTRVINWALSTGSFTLTGIDIIWKQVRNLLLGTATFTLTGIDILWTKTLNWGLATGSFTITGINIVWKRVYNWILGVGSFVLNFNTVKNITWINQQKDGVVDYTNQSKSATPTTTNQSKSSSNWTNQT